MDMKMMKKQALNDYIETYTGRHFKVMFPDIDDIDIIDIAHALSMQCRFTGHSSRFYSIAEHSVHVSYMCGDDPIDMFWGLMHDASEAYLTDVAAPVKPYLQNYKEIEASLMEVICYKFGLPLGEPNIVKKADMKMLKIEAAELMASKGLDWRVKGVSLEELGDQQKVNLKLYSPEEAKEVFLRRFKELSELINK